MTSDLTFRAQLVFREQRQIFDYWRSCSRGQTMPARSDLDPSFMLPYLPFICLIDILDGLPDAFVRLAGTSVREVYGFELTGKCLGELEWGERAGYWHQVYRHVVETGIPSQGMIHGPIPKREHVTLHWLRLPLSDDGKKVNKILCCEMAVPRYSDTRSDRAKTNKQLLASS